MLMKIEKNKVASFHYKLSDDNGVSLEESTGGDPVAFLQGAHNILPAVERELEGLEAGDSKSVKLRPKQAYGEYNAEAVMRVPIKNLVGKGGKVKVGQIIDVDTDQGPRTLRVIKAGKFNATVDTNHPYAGKSLIFDIEVVDVRDATAEEIAHGHAHGLGGHQH